MVSSACLSSQAWKSFTKGIEQSIGNSVSNSISTSPKYDVKNCKSKKTANLSKETSVQKKAALTYVIITAIQICQGGIFAYIQTAQLIFRASQLFQSGIPAYIQTA